jgi:hypothetical protein
MAHVPSIGIHSVVVVVVVCSDTILATRRAQALARPDCVAYKIRHDNDEDDDDMLTSIMSTIGPITSAALQSMK